MTGKHYGWQKRWTIDAVALTATHDSGLVVRITGTPPRAEAVNLEELRPALTAKHGPHNVPPMVGRWLREAEKLHGAAAASTGGREPGSAKE